MDKCYFKPESKDLREAVQEIVQEECLTIGEMAAFAVAVKEGLFSVTILIKEDGIKINQIDLSESYVVTYNTVYSEDGLIKSYLDCVSRDVFESGVLNNNKNFEVSLLLDYKKN